MASVRWHRARPQGALVAGTAWATENAAWGQLTPPERGKGCWSRHSLASSVLTANRVIAGLPAWPQAGDDADLPVLDARTPGEGVALVPERRRPGAVAAARGRQPSER